MINDILDSADKKQTVLAGSDKGMLIEQSPYKVEMRQVIQLSKELKDMYHKIRNLISEHKESIKKTHFFCDFLV